MKNYDSLSFAVGEKQEAKITARAPVLPLPGLSIYWFPFGTERSHSLALKQVRIRAFGFDLTLIKASAFSFNRREAY
jgi:hypothetical protein